MSSANNIRSCFALIARLCTLWCGPVVVVGLTSLVSRVLYSMLTIVVLYCVRWHLYIDLHNKHALLLLLL